MAPRGSGYVGFVYHWNTVRRTHWIACLRDFKVYSQSRNIFVKSKSICTRAAYFSFSSRPFLARSSPGNNFWMAIRACG
jgi:hypothetical protein